MSGGFAISLSGGVDAARAARRAIAEHHPALPQPVGYDLELLVTELVTNAVRHGGAAASQPVQVEVRTSRGRIRVDVVDPGVDFDAPPRPGNGDSNGGWGLFLLDKIAESWGVCPAPAGTCVWFEVPAGVSA
jgi:anti-sigma regulatory factor (Ser/Thr protein kinase)